MAENKIISYDVELLSTSKRYNYHIPEVFTNDLLTNEFQFNVLDMTEQELSGATADVLLSMRDGSFFNNYGQATRSGTTFKYVLKENEGNHYGLAKVQLVVRVAGQRYATPLYNFAIMQGLNDKVANEVVINDLNSETRKEIAKLKSEWETEIGGLSAQFQQIINETTGKDFTSAPEIIAARKGKVDLATRLNDFENETNERAIERDDELFNMQLTNKYSTRPSLTIIDDDGRPNVYIKLKLLAQEYNIPVTSAVITGRVGDDSSHISKAQMVELAELGFEFVSHTESHPYLATLTASEIERELKNSAEWLNDNGFDGYTTIVYPFGSVNADVFRIARKYYKSGFDIPINGGKTVTPPLNQFAIQRVTYNSMDGTYDTTAIKAKIDESLLNNGWTIAMTHAGYNGFTIDGLREIVEYANLKGVEIITVKEGLKRFGNVLDVSNDYSSAVIGADGQLSGGLRNVTKSNFIKLGSPITAYPEGISLTHINNGHVAIADFPLSIGGTLETHRPENVGFSRQEYVTYTTKDEYFRYWDVATESWSSWEKRTNAYVNNSTASTPVSELKVGVTISYISTANASGLPNSVGGTLVTYKPSLTSGTAYQTFKKHNSNDTYVRNSSSTNTWGDWVNVSRPHNYPTSVAAVGGWTGNIEYSKTQDGLVWVRGVLTAGTVSPGTVIASFPYGFSIGVFYNYFTVHNHTKALPVPNGLYMDGRNLRVGASGISQGDNVRFSILFQSTENA